MIISSAKLFTSMRLGLTEPNDSAKDIRQGLELICQTFPVNALTELFDNWLQCRKCLRLQGINVTSIDDNFYAARRLFHDSIEMSATFSETSYSHYLVLSCSCNGKSVLFRTVVTRLQN